MLPFASPSSLFARLRHRRSSAIATAFAAVLLLLGPAGFGQAATKVLDTSALHPPPGARVAIVEFSDLECPACAYANPVLKQAASKYGIPWVHHDFLIPGHLWSPVAAVNARWFDAARKGLGDEYRDAVFANQRSIYNLGVLNEFTQKFAQNHGVALPFSVDPQGKFSREVQTDTQLGQRTGIVHTPTIFIVTDAKAMPYVEVEYPDRDLYQTIDRALAVAKTAPAPVTTTTHHKAKK